MKLDTSSAQPTRPVCLCGEATIKSPHHGRCARRSEAGGGGAVSSVDQVPHRARRPRPAGRMKLSALSAERGVPQPKTKSKIQIRKQPHPHRSTGPATHRTQGPGALPRPVRDGARRSLPARSRAALLTAWLRYRDNLMSRPISLSHSFGDRKHPTFRLTDYGRRSYAPVAFRDAHLCVCESE